MNRLQSNTRIKLESDRELEIFIDKHSKSNSDPTDWMIEQILTFSDVKGTDIEEEFGISRDSKKTPLQNSISGTQRNSGPGIFLHKPQPEWIQEYVEAKNEAIEYFQRQIEILREMKRDQTV